MRLEDEVDVNPGSSGRADPAGAASDAELAVARCVLDVTRHLVLELHPHHRSSLRVSLGDSLDEDLHLDSLGRMELLLRLERATHVRLPQALLVEAITPADLVSGVLAARAGGAAPAARVRDLALGPAPSTPAHARTLLAVLEWHCREHPERSHLVLEGEGGDRELSYAELRARAGAVGAGLRARGIAPGDSVAIMLATGPEFFAAFLGALWAGAVPVPIYPPFRRSQLADHLRRQAGILENARARALIAAPEAHAAASLLRSEVGGLGVETVPALSALAGAGDPGAPHAARAQDTALLQYTSGSTGHPKGVVLSHANLLANIRAMGRATDARSTDVFVSWLPLYHDMGLIGAWLGSLYHAVPAAISSPIGFLARPASWLWAIHRHRGTISAAPNFAYEICASRIEDAELAGLDLSSWRLAMNGAEPVSPDTLRRFAQRMAPYGFRSEALTPVYGLAECAVGLAFPPPGRGPRIDRVSRAALTRSGTAQPAAADDASALEFASCGLPLPGHELRIVDASGRECGERREGRLQFRGPSATCGYLRNEAKTRELFAGAWLESGDLAYLADGEVHLTGRIKDMILRAGRNLYPQEVEEAVGAIPGVRKGCVAAFGSPDPRRGTERVILVAETREADPARREALRRSIGAVATPLLEGAPDEIVLAPPHAVLKTSSGKLRRSACRELYERGALSSAAPSVRLQIAQLVASGAVARARRAVRRAGELGYAAWWWALLAGTAVVAWPLVLALPGAGRRWAVARAAARWFLRASGTRLQVRGLEQLKPCSTAVVVANHSSYLDGLVLTAALPRPVHFIAKRELAGQRVAGPFLRRLGALFVERFELERSVEDARRLDAAVRRGGWFLFFPEGTFRREPGLRPFHLGAFQAAVQSGAPLVPAALGGTRSILRADQWFPRRGSVQLTFGPPLRAHACDWSGAVELRDAARAWMLGACAEPDLDRADARASG